jgi:hypothetical protein
LLIFRVALTSIILAPFGRLASGCGVCVGLEGFMTCSGASTPVELSGFLGGGDGLNVGHDLVGHCLRVESLWGERGAVEGIDRDSSFQK